MSVEPVTVTITTEIETGEVQHQLARVKAAEELGLDPAEILCVDVGAVTTSREAVWKDREPTDDNGNTKELVTPAEYTFSSTWAPKHVDAKRVHPEPSIPWPVVRLSRGAKWHGPIPDPAGGNERVEAMLISTGDKLVLLDGPEGQAVLAEIGGERPVSSTVAGNSFG